MATKTAPTAAARRRRHQEAATGQRVIVAAIYTRLSLDRTGEGAAVDRQEEDARAMAKLKGWTVPDELVFSDNSLSATSGKTRPGFERLIKAIRAGKCQAVVVWHMDRLVRLTTDLLRVIEVGKDDGFSIIAVHGPSLDMSDPTGVAVAHILVAIAEMEVKHKGERQFRANLAQREAGVMPWKKCYGYRNLFTTDSNGKQHLTGFAEIVEDEAVVVREIFERFNAGAGIWTITKWLNAEGIASSVGRAWSRQQVRDLLSNPRFIAKSTLADGPRKKEIIGDGNWEPIVSEAVFDTAQNRLNEPARMASGRNGSARKWLGAGFYRCGVCGTAMVSWYGGYSTTINPETGKRIGKRAYKCPEGHLRRQAEEIDEHVILKIAEFLTKNQDELRKRLANADNSAKAVELRAKKAEQEALFQYLKSEMQKAGRHPETIAALAAGADSAVEKINDIQRDIEELGDPKSAALNRVLAADDAGVMWQFDLDVNSQIEVGREVCNVEVLPVKPARRPKGLSLADTLRISPTSSRFGFSATEVA